MTCYPKGWYAAYPKELVIDPKGANDGPFRVLRGWSFKVNGSAALSFGRNHLRTPDLRFDSIVFRLVKTQ